MTPRKRICHVTSNLSQSLFLEAVGKYVDKEKYDQEFVILGDHPGRLFQRLSAAGFKTHFIEFRWPHDTAVAIRELAKHLRSRKVDIVHTHLVQPSLIGLLAGLFARVKCRVHTRHHGSECHRYFPRGVYYDRLINRLSHKIMAITNVVGETLTETEKVPRDKVRVINYGYDLSKFLSSDEAVEDLKRKYKLSTNYPVIGAVSRFVHWKGVQFIIPAFAAISVEFPEAKLVLANAVGAYSDEIEELLEQYLRPDQYVRIPFEAEIFALYRTFDVFVHVPIDRELEAFGQTYIEPLYLGVPSVFTLSGIANDFIRDGQNALVVRYCDSAAISSAIRRLLDSEELRTAISRTGRSDIESRFSGERLANDLDQFYRSLEC